MEGHQTSGAQEKDRVFCPANSDLAGTFDPSGKSLCTGFVHRKQVGRLASIHLTSTSLFMLPRPVFIAVIGQVIAVLPSERGHRGLRTVEKKLTLPPYLRHS
jgi:hypothetical protein